MPAILRGARVFDGERFGEPTDVVVDGVLIGDEAPVDAGVVDASGCFLLPGLIDCHIHLAGPHTQELLATWGVTTALDMSSPPPLVDAMRGRPRVADIRAAMMAMTSPTSAHAERMKSMPGASEAFVAGPANAAAAVQRRIDQGADYLKVVIDLPGFERDTVAAIVDVSHEHGKQVVAHASRLDAVTMAHEAGVDVLTHVPLDRPIDADLAAEIAASGTVAVPTLAMMKGIVDRMAANGVPGLAYEAARDSVTALHEAGVPILAGTDANEAPAVPASPSFGTSLHDELALLVDAGLTPVAALRAATSVAADRFRLGDRGNIAPGLRGDLVLLDADPTASIGATRSIRGVWIAGQRVVGGA